MIRRLAEGWVGVAFAELVGVAGVVEVDGAHLVFRNTIAALPFNNSHAVFVTVSSCRMNFSLHFSYPILWYSAFNSAMTLAANVLMSLEAGQLIRIWSFCSVVRNYFFLTSPPCAIQSTISFVYSPSAHKPFLDAHRNH